MQPLLGTDFRLIGSPFLTHVTPQYMVLFDIQSYLNVKPHLIGSLVSSSRIVRHTTAKDPELLDLCVGKRPRLCKVGFASAAAAYSLSQIV